MTSLSNQPIVCHLNFHTRHSETTRLPRLTCDGHSKDRDIVSSASSDAHRNDYGQIGTDWHKLAANPLRFPCDLTGQLPAEAIWQADPFGQAVPMT
jgi:hypothetical protein